MLKTPIMVNSYEAAITMLIIRDVVESLPDSSTALVNEIGLKMLLLMPNAEVCRLTPPVLIPVLILSERIAYYVLRIATTLCRYRVMESRL